MTVACRRGLTVKARLNLALSVRSDLGYYSYLTLWVALCIVIGVGLGQLMLEVFQFIGRVEVAHINLPAMLIAVRVVHRSRSWYESRDGIVTYDECCPAAMPPDTPR